MPRVSISTTFMVTPDNTTLAGLATAIRALIAAGVPETAQVDLASGTLLITVADRRASEIVKEAVEGSVV